MQNINNPTNEMISKKIFIQQINKILFNKNDDTVQFTHYSFQEKKLYKQMIGPSPL